MTAPVWEKQGNVAWVQCPHCEDWLPVEPRLIDDRRIRCVCPGCERRFTGAEAKQTVRP